MSKPTSEFLVSFSDKKLELNIPQELAKTIIILAKDKGQSPADFVQQVVTDALRPKAAEEALKEHPEKK